MAKRNVRGRQAEDKQLDQLFHKTKAMPALISVDELDGIEARMADSHHDDGITRRAMLILLTRPAKWVFEEIEKDRDTAVALAQAAKLGEQYGKFLEELARIVATSSARVMMALCQREDMQEVLADAAEGESDE